VNFLSILLFFSLASAQSALPDFTKASFVETLARLVKADMTNPPGNESRAIPIIGERLKAAGIAFEVIEFAPGRQNLVARLKGNGQAKPLLLLAHLDVVGTKDQAWSVPPQELTEKDGFFYGRGVRDDLGSVVAQLEVFIKLKKSQAALKRDVILAFTGDEESGGAGIKYLLEKRPELLDAEIALNEGGSPLLDEHGKVKFYRIQVAEKTYQDFRLKTKGETGHASVPKKENSIYRLAKALIRLSEFKFPDRLLPVTRAYFAQLAKLEQGSLASAMRSLANSKGPLPRAALARVKENPANASMLATTCVATMLQSGTKVNALPPEATANLNCRLLPDETIEQTKLRLTKVINDPKVEIEIAPEFGSADPSPITGEAIEAVRETVGKFWPGVPIIPYLQTGGTDSRFLRARGIRAYGVDPFAVLEADASRAHGIDERLPVASIEPGLEFFYQLVLRLAENPS
jgi:acetylornithine deacetylase/succinyl-diaminopimelate desuccinylase-like protein